MTEKKQLPEEILQLDSDTVDMLRYDFENYLKRTVKNIKFEDLTKVNLNTGEYASLYTRYAWASWLHCYDQYWNKQS